MILKKTVAAVATAAAFIVPSVSSAISFGMQFDGFITLLNSTGAGVQNTSITTEPRFQGWRTPVQGNLELTIDGAGLRVRATFTPFLFQGQIASGRDITFRPPNTILGGIIPTNTLFLANLLFDFGANIPGIPVSLVADAGNLTTALRTAKLGDIIRGIARGESDNTIFPTAQGPRTLPIGPVLFATTDLNTTDVDTDDDQVPGPIFPEVNPSGTTPLLVDTAVDSTNGDIGIGGSPIKATAFSGFNANFDIFSLRVKCVRLLGTCPLPP